MPGSSILTVKLQSDSRQRKRTAALTEMTFMTGAESLGDNNETMRIYQRITKERKDDEEEK